MNLEGLRRPGMVAGLIGALLIGVAGLIGYGYGESILFATLLAFLSVFGQSGKGERAFASGLFLILLTVIGLISLYFAAGALPLVGSSLVFVGGAALLASGVEGRDRTPAPGYRSASIPTDR